MSRHHEDGEPTSDRFRVGNFSAGDVALFKDIAEQAAENAVNKTFVAMGHDPKEPLIAQLDAAWTRRMRERAEGVVGKMILTVAGAATLGGLNALWNGIKATLASTPSLPPH